MRNMEYELLINLLREQSRPFFQLKPNLIRIQSGWSAQYGNLIGNGKTPAEAADDFDKNFFGIK